MDTSALTAIGRNWAGLLRSVYRTLRDAVGGDPRLAAPVASASAPVAVRTGASAEPLRTAGAALRRAFDSLSTRTRAIYSTTLYTGPSTAGVVRGITARVADVGTPSMLRTTVEVNTQASTVRTSSSALGLDVTDAASELHSAALGLDVTSAQSASTLESTAQMNAATTSLSSYGLSFTGSSSEAQISGAYTGSATSLTFRIVSGGAINSPGSPISLSVVDQNNVEVASFAGTVTPNQVISLGDTGLKVRFTQGLLVAGSATTTVSQTPTDVSTTALFNAGWATGPKFEDFQQVVAGSFTVNGTAVTVQQNDSISSVVSRINSTVAGVSASVSGDRITLSTTSNSEDAIVVGNDTSGFLAATKLSAATTTLGNIRDDEQVFAKTSQFSAVATGAFTINGVSISVNRDTDSLTSLIGRINASAAGVTASYDTATDTLELASTSPSEDVIAVGDDTSGFLTVAGLSTNNTATGNIGDDVQVMADTPQFASVAAGTFEINGVSIALDPATDSLQDVLAAINASGAGVTASYDPATDRVAIEPDVAGAALTVASDATGFLAAISMATGTTATVANADGAFNAAGTSGPQFDPGVTVTAGSFTVNGVAIAVAADDTINTVLARIAASAAGVTASYDAATETITLTSSTVTGDPIVVGNDTSGFLAAAKLDGTAESTALPGTSAFDAVLADMGEYAAVTAGTVTVNGHQIAIDPATSTIADVVAALDAMPDVWAAVDRDTGRVTIGSLPGGSVTISDTSGLLSALGISAGTYAGSAGETTALETQVGAVPTNTADVVAAVGTATDQLNVALAQFAEGSAAVETLMDGLQRAGVSGFSAAPGDAPVSLSLDRDALTDSLNGLSRPAEARKAIAAVLDQFTAQIAAAATPPEPPPPERIAIQVSGLPRLDPQVAQARIAAARSAPRKAAGRKDPPYGHHDDADAVARRAPLYGGADSNGWPTAAPKSGLFDGLFEGWFSRW